MVHLTRIYISHSSGAHFRAPSPSSSATSFFDAATVTVCAVKVTSPKRIIIVKTVIQWQRIALFCPIVSRLKRTFCICIDCVKTVKTRWCSRAYALAHECEYTKEKKNLRNELEMEINDTYANCGVLSLFHVPKPDLFLNPGRFHSASTSIWHTYNVQSPFLYRNGK